MLQSMDADDDAFVLINTSGTGKVFILKEDGQKEEIKHANVARTDRVSIGDYETVVAELIAKVKNATEVFISYSHHDTKRAQKIGDFLSRHGLRVWRDHRLEVARPYDDQIEAQLKSARCIVVLWSTESVKSSWVKAEAQFAHDRRVLVPVFIENEVEVPLLYRRIQGAFVTNWGTNEVDDQLAHLAKKIDSFLRISR